MRISECLFFFVSERHLPPISRGWPGRPTGQAGHNPSAMFQNDMIQLDDGTQISLYRPNSVDDNDWDSVKDYLQTHSKCRDDQEHPPISAGEMHLITDTRTHPIP